MDKDSKEYVLKIYYDIYGQRNTSQVWNKYLVDILTNKLKFKQSEYDKCLFYHSSTVCVLCIDNSILAGLNKDKINKIINNIEKCKLNILVLGNIKDFLGVNITKEEDGCLYMCQPYLID